MALEGISSSIMGYLRMERSSRGLAFERISSTSVEYYSILANVMYFYLRSRFHIICFYNHDSVEIIPKGNKMKVLITRQRYSKVSLVDSVKEYFYSIRLPFLG